MIGLSARPYPLNQPLPNEISQGPHMFVTRYKDYPVFGWSWWWRRMLFFMPFGIVLFALPFWAWIRIADLRVAIIPPLIAMTQFLLCAGFGVGVAGIVRHRRMSPRLEGWGITISILVFLGISLWINKEMSDLSKPIVDAYPEMKARAAKSAEIVKDSHISITFLQISNYFICGFFSGFLCIPAYFRERWRWNQHLREASEANLRVQKQEVSLRLSLLQAQVEPHFLFNTLALVRAMIRQDPSQSEAALDALVNYLRASIPHFRGDGVTARSTLGQQAELCSSYLEVMRIRTADRLQYRVDVDSEIRDVQFPPMLLITLVENAIKHGIEPKPGPGRVVIAAERMAQRLRVTVRDDGVGLQPGLGGGLGLANVRAQLDALYGGRATFSLESAAQGGVCASLDLPLDEVQA